MCPPTRSASPAATASSRSTHSASPRRARLALPLPPLTHRQYSPAVLGTHGFSTLCRTRALTARASSPRRSPCTPATAPIYAGGHGVLRAPSIQARVAGRAAQHAAALPACAPRGWSPSFAGLLVGPVARHPRRLLRGPRLRRRPLCLRHGARAGASPAPHPPGTRPAPAPHPPRGRPATPCLAMASHPPAFGVASPVPRRCLAPALRRACTPPRLTRLSSPCAW